MKREFKIEYDNKIYKGFYEISGSIRDEKSMITVYYNFINKTTQLGGHVMNPELLAKKILLEMI